MCNANPAVPCTQAHHISVILEIWSNDLSLENNLILATRTDLDSAVALVAKTYTDSGVTAIATDWFTGKQMYLKAPRKRRQVQQVKGNAQNMSAYLRDGKKTYLKREVK